MKIKTQFDYMPNNNFKIFGNDKKMQNIEKYNNVYDDNNIYHKFFKNMDEFYLKYDNNEKNIIKGEKKK